MLSTTQGFDQFDQFDQSAIDQSIVSKYIILLQYWSMIDQMITDRWSIDRMIISSMNDRWTIDNRSFIDRSNDHIIDDRSMNATVVRWTIGDRSIIDRSSITDHRSKLYRSFDRSVIDRSSIDHRSIKWSISFRSISSSDLHYQRLTKTWSSRCLNMNWGDDIIQLQFTIIELSKWWNSHWRNFQRCNFRRWNLQ